MPCQAQGQRMAMGKVHLTEHNVQPTQTSLHPKPEQRIQDDAAPDYRRLDHSTLWFPLPCLAIVGLPHGPSMRLHIVFWRSRRSQIDLPPKQRVQAAPDRREKFLIHP